MINRNDVERDLLVCRRLITRAVTDQPEFSTMEKIRADYLEFLARQGIGYGTILSRNIVRQYPAMSKPKADKPSEEYERFEKLAKQLISVPKSEIDKREAEYQKQRKLTRRKESRK